MNNATLTKNLGILQTTHPQLAHEIGDGTELINL